jgi:hypothetical protein
LSGDHIGSDGVGVDTGQIAFGTRAVTCGWVVSAWPETEPAGCWVATN